MNKTAKILGGMIATFTLIEIIYIALFLSNTVKIECASPLLIIVNMMIFLTAIVTVIEVKSEPSGKPALAITTATFSGLNLGFSLYFPFAK